MVEGIVRFAEISEGVADVAAVLVVLFGTVEAFVRVVRVAVTPRVTHGQRKEVWRNYGMWLLLGLEFELAADIIGSVVSPTWEEVAMLGAIAVIRTFLNYFLGRDLVEARELGEPEAARLEPGPSHG